MAIEKDFFRQVMGRFMTGVTIVTTHDNGEPVGLTVNAFASVSLHPPLVLICIDLYSSVLPALRASRVFAVNILNAQQENLSRCFATSSTERYEHFCYADYYTAATGAPVLDGVLAFIDARIVAEYPGGDHMIFLGQVEAVGAAGQIAFSDDANLEQATILGHAVTITNEEDLPLGYYRGQYRHLAPDYRKPSLNSHSGTRSELTSRGKG
jgi:flavin reductase (DIM6/NTAB) family NADH-FMN oxidoreductase RutF